jgi:hypothetical protein
MGADTWCSNFFKAGFVPELSLRRYRGIGNFVNYPRRVMFSHGRERGHSDIAGRDHYMLAADP